SDTHVLHLLSLHDALPISTSTSVMVFLFMHLPPQSQKRRASFSSSTRHKAHSLGTHPYQEVAWQGCKGIGSGKHMVSSSSSIIVMLIGLWKQYTLRGQPHDWNNPIRYHTKQQL